MHVHAGETEFEVDLEEAEVMTRPVEPMNTNDEVEAERMEDPELVRDLKVGGWVGGASGEGWKLKPKV